MPRATPGRWLAVLGWAVLRWAALPCAAQSAVPPVRGGMLVSTAWLAAHAKDPDLVVLHVADTFADYRRGHIPGARFLATAKFIENGGKLGSELPPVEGLAKAFGELGVSAKSRVVLYTTAWPPTAARAWFTLDVLGLGDRAALLDGGVEQWLAEDRPVTQALPAFPPASLEPRARPEARATLEEVRRALDAPGGPSCRLVDSRPASRFQAGHLPGAANLYWKDTLESDEHPVLLPAEKLRALLAARGLKPGTKVVTYCEVGLQASHGYFLLKYLGYDAAMYDGSYQEWSAAKLPVVTGEK
ncbi:MAG: rhodanese-like domain-containing protein [Holophagaceae bacterium]